MRRIWSFRNVQLMYLLIIVYQKSLGDSSGGDTPGPILNPAVKPASADGTWGAAPWESKSLPRDFVIQGKKTTPTYGVVFFRGVKFVCRAFPTCFDLSSIRHLRPRHL